MFETLFIAIICFKWVYLLYLHIFFDIYFFYICRKLKKNSYVFIIHFKYHRHLFSGSFIMDNIKWIISYCLVKITVFLNILIKVFRFFCPFTEKNYLIEECIFNALSNGVCHLLIFRLELVHYFSFFKNSFPAISGYFLL